MILNKEFHSAMWKEYCYTMKVNPPSKFWYLQEHQQEYKDFIAMYISYGNPFYGKNV
jgi:hypothetical protein